MTDPLQHYVNQSNKQPIKPLNTPTEIGTSFNEIMQRNAKQRWISNSPLESALLLKRVRQGGASGNFLGTAFISAYDMSNFNQSLGEICNLDAEGRRLFHQIVDLRFIKDWRDDDYNSIANQIETLLNLPY